MNKFNDLTPHLVTLIRDLHEKSLNGKMEKE
jgi:hypothetical protein